MGTVWSSVSLYSLSGKTITIFVSWCLPTKKIKNRSCKSTYCLGLEVTYCYLHSIVFGQGKSQGQPKLRDRINGLHFPMKWAAKSHLRSTWRLMGLLWSTLKKMFLSPLSSHNSLLLQTKYTQLIPHSLIPLLGQAQNLVADDVYQVQIQMRCRNS